MKIEIAELGQKLQMLENKAFDLLDSTGKEEQLIKLKSELEELKKNPDLKVAFVGQYSSGKSTIISAITGNRDIKIDANVATDQVSEYRWNNIVLLDTPGIKAGVTNEHDEKTKEALKTSDLIVYVLTSQLFDDVIFDNFIDLAYNQALKDKMLIAINKMSMEASGNFEELKENYLNSIKTIFKERNYDFDFPIVFIDAADYIEGLEEQDEDFVQLSNFQTFISTLNNFTEEKGLIKKSFDTPVRLIRDNITQLALNDIDPNLKIITEQGLKKMKNSKITLSRNVKYAVLRFENEIRNQGYDLGNKIDSITQEDFKREQENYESFINTKYNELECEIEDIITSEQDDLISDMAAFSAKESINAFRLSLDTKIKDTGNNSSFTKQKEILNLLTRGTDQLVKKSIGNATLKGLKQASGSEIHKTVLTIGKKFFNKQFKPWEAVKISDKIGKVGKWGGPVLAIVGLGLEVWGKYKEEDRSKKIAAAKNQFFDVVRSLAKDISNEILNSFEEYLKNTYGEKINQIEIELVNLATLDERNKTFSEAIKKLDSELVEFIELTN